MLAQCGLYLQKLLNAQSQTFQKPLETTCPLGTKTDMNHPFVAADVCLPIIHQKINYLVADEDAVITDKPLETDNECITHLEHAQNINFTSLSNALNVSS